LQFAKDCQRWMRWLFEAKKRYGLILLDYIVTSNHIHLLVYKTKGSENKRVIERCLRQHIQRTGATITGWKDKPTKRPTAFMMNYQVHSHSGAQIRRSTTVGRIPKTCILGVSQGSERQSGCLYRAMK